MQTALCLGLCLTEETEDPSVSVSLDGGYITLAYESRCCKSLNWRCWATVCAVIRDEIVEEICVPAFWVCLHTNFLLQPRLDNTFSSTRSPDCSKLNEVFCALAQGEADPLG